MARLFFFSILCFITIGNVAAQTNYAPKPMAFAKGGDDSYLFHSNKYDPSKKYTVLKVWNDKYELTKTEKENLDYLKQNLTKNNIEVVEYKWTHEEDLISFMSKYGLTASIKQNNCMSIRKGNGSLNTTAGKAVFVLEEGKPTSLCSGKMCEDNLKRFFGLVSTN